LLLGVVREVAGTSRALPSFDAFRHHRDSLTMIYKHIQPQQIHLSVVSTWVVVHVIIRDGEH